MRLLQVFRYLRRSSPQPGAPQAPGTANATVFSPIPNPTQRSSHTLDKLAVQTALIHHLEWCVLFNEHLSVNGLEAPHLPALPSATESGLGLWLENLRQGPTQGAPGLDELTAEHQRFHDLAQQALDMARQGRMDLASTLLNTDFERSRARVLQLLRNMQKG